MAELGCETQMQKLRLGLVIPTYEYVGVGFAVSRLMSSRYIKYEECVSS